jgi:hypothetical protein
MFKVWLLISNFILFKYLIVWLNQLHVSYKSNVFQPYASHKGFENFKISLSMLLFKNA